MGFSTSWIAVKGKSKEEVLAQLGLVDKGTADTAREEAMSGAQLPGGVYLISFNTRAIHKMVSDEVLLPLSSGCEVLGCVVDENYMLSGAFMNVDGVIVWDIAHYPKEYKDQLEVEGTPPPVFDTIRAQVQAAQDEADDDGVDHTFDIPILLAESMAGYRHDRLALATGEEPVFTKLVRKTSRKKAA